MSRHRAGHFGIRVFLFEADQRSSGRSGRRNHSVQYISFPEFPWYRLRKESPEKYETYADVVPGEWTKVRIEVKGNRARLFVGNA